MNNIPIANIPENLENDKAERIKFIQVYLGDEPYIRFDFSNDEKPRHWKVLKAFLEEAGIKYETIPNCVPNREPCPMPKGNGYTVVGMGTTEIELYASTKISMKGLITLSDYSHDYGYGADEFHLILLKKKLPDWDMRTESSR